MGWQDRSYNRDESGGVPPVSFRFPPISPGALGVIIACTVMFFVQAGTRHRIDDYLDLTFAGNTAWWQPWRFITYQYLHGGFGHLFFNMIGVYFFLPSLEQFWGRTKALIFYTLGGVAAGLTYYFFSLFNPSAGLVGASGSVLAVLGAVALFFPDRVLILLFFPVPIRIAALLLGVLFVGTAVADGDLSNAAHLGGLAFGFFAPWIAGPYLIKQQRRYEQFRDDRAARAEIDEQREIDRILAKVSASGMNSLTRSEKRTLAQASERQKARDRKRAAQMRY